MVNFTCPVGSHPFSTTSPLAPLIPDAQINDSIREIVGRVGFGPLAIATFAAVIAGRYILDIGARRCYFLIDSWDQYRRGLQAIQAAQQGNARFIMDLDPIVSPISDEHRGLAIIYAAKYGHKAIVISLLASGEISEKDRGQAIIYAAERGHLRIVRDLLNGELPGNGDISEKDRGEAIVQAIKTFQIDRQRTDHSDLRDIIRLLLASGRISKEDRSIATELAAGSGVPDPTNAKIVTSLLISGEISEEHRGEAVKAASRWGNTAIVRALLNGELPGSGPISQIVRGDAISQAAEKGEIGIVTVLLDQRYPITDEARGLATLAAFWRQEGGRRAPCREIMTLLLDSGQISLSDDNRGTAVKEAVKQVDEDFLKLLLANGPISQAHLGLAVREAACQGDLEFVRLLFANGSISEEDRQIAQDGARSPEIIAFLQAQQNPAVRLYGSGVNIHATDRDESTRSAIELLRTDTGTMSQYEIDRANDEFLAYLRRQPASEARTLAEKAVIGPREHGAAFGPLQPDDTLTIHGLAIPGKEVIARFWRFCNAYVERAPGANIETERENALQPADTFTIHALAIPGREVITRFWRFCMAFVERAPGSTIETERENARRAMVGALARCHDLFGMVCNPGKVQRLVVDVLEGRLALVNVTPVAAAAIALDAINGFWADVRHHEIPNREDLRTAAHRYIDEHPAVQGFRGDLLANVDEFAAQQQLPDA